MSVAFLIDGGFFLKRYRATYGPYKSPDQVAKMLMGMCYAHMKKLNEVKKDLPRETFTLELYRIFFYDCEPYTKRVHNPVSGKCIDFSRTPIAIFRENFFQELRKQRKVALRLGYLQDNAGWKFASDKTKELLKGKTALADLTEEDVRLDLKQKGVDIKIGLDIASLAYKKLVKKIVLISGDSDFVPAAKLARREGIDFILDPMWNPIDNNLFEHVDGLWSTCPRPKKMRSP